MRGSPLVRALLAFFVIALLGWPLWQLTGRRRRDARAAGRAADDQEGHSLASDFYRGAAEPDRPPPGRRGLKATAPEADMEKDVSLDYPAEGVDLQFHVEWPEGGPLAAMRVELTDPAGDTHDKSVWGKGIVDEVVTFHESPPDFSRPHCRPQSGRAGPDGELPPRAGAAHIAFEVRCGETVALLGPNGAGKSTLLKSLAGLLPRETGSITFHGKEVHAATQDFAYLPQRERLFHARCRSSCGLRASRRGGSRQSAGRKSIFPLRQVGKSCVAACTSLP